MRNVAPHSFVLVHEQYKLTTWALCFSRDVIVALASQFGQVTPRHNIHQPLKNALSLYTVVGCMTNNHLAIS
ncbi:hypothetical protein [Pseudoalteromonas sp. SWYJZ19]|uniref:hypothetical protein n=1 Tax=Pseudoalteromonas sp. SWYJZ19 TaxID=2792068 RepID=UPI001E3C6A87|nr:hypothetical protein [Pseudoalteromonas sp. SWYJZ19]